MIYYTVTTYKYLYYLLRYNFIGFLERVKSLFEIILHNDFDCHSRMSLNILIKKTKFTIYYQNG